MVSEFVFCGSSSYRTAAFSVFPVNKQLTSQFAEIFIIPLRALPFDGHNFFSFAAESPYEQDGPEMIVVPTQKKSYSMFQIYVPDHKNCVFV